MREATSLFKRANDLDFAQAQSLGVANSRYRVLDDVWARHIGDTATLDYVIKQGILEGRRREDIILYAPPGGRIGNRFLVQQLATRLRLVERPDDLPFDPAAVQALHYHYQFPRQPDGATVFFWELASEIHQRWHKESRGPLLELPPDIAARGWALLHAAGVPRGAWFVALHVRDIAWKGLNAGMQTIRNADTAAYVPAIAEITRRGGYVVRMGDADAPPLPPLANVVDYCRSDMRADWMDIFLMARSRFMLGSASGPIFVPPLYGVPAVLTNWWPPGMRPWHAADIFVPKLLRRSADGRHLTLDRNASRALGLLPFAALSRRTRRRSCRRQRSGTNPRGGRRNAVAARRQCRLRRRRGGTAHPRRPHLPGARPFRRRPAWPRFSPTATAISLHNLVRADVAMSDGYRRRPLNRGALPNSSIRGLIARRT